MGRLIRPMRRAAIVAAWAATYAAACSPSLPESDAAAPQDAAIDFESTTPPQGDAAIDMNSMGDAAKASAFDLASITPPQDAAAIDLEPLADLRAQPDIACAPTTAHIDCGQNGGCDDPRCEEIWLQLGRQNDAITCCWPGLECGLAENDCRCMEDGYWGCETGMFGGGGICDYPALARVEDCANMFTCSYACQEMRRHPCCAGDGNLICKFPGQDCTCDGVGGLACVAPGGFDLGVVDGD